MPNEPGKRLADLRQEYTLAGLSESDLEASPIRQFQKWFQEALIAGLREPNAMVLATADKTARPSTRIVLLKDVDERGFTFFTNYDSRKGHELAENPHAALNFPWIDLERQICISGTVAKVSREESAAYFKIRPRGSRLGAWASQQSQVISNRTLLEERMKLLEQQYPGEEVPLPPNWGGYLLSPTQIEFWQGRPNRLHDRFCYFKQADGSWKINRLSP